MLYIYKTVRRAAAQGGAEFVPELVHNRSGVGSMIQTADLNKDGHARHHGGHDPRHVGVLSEKVGRG